MNYVYPGHPLVIAVCIMEKYPDLKSARAKGLTFAEALEDSDIPGAGGNVYAALTVLEKSLDEGIMYAKYVWQSCCQGCFSDYYDEGVCEAKGLEERYRELRSNWK